jgi:mRNA interferase MazF
MTKGKVVLVPFPFDDLSASKVRPAVCLTEPVGPHRQVVLAFVTSRPSESPLPSDVSIVPGEAGFASTGLRVASTLCLHRLLTVAATVIVRELGELPAAKLDEVNRKLGLLFRLG